MKIKTKLDDCDLHYHLKIRMLQRGVTKKEIETTLTKGWNADDAKPNTFGKVFAFPYNAEWEGRFFDEKEVRIYYKFINGEFILLSVKARYGKDFSRGGSLK
ncbi:hypothetical protein KKG22_06140 [Patescibacteria group bacterium]|nr:hypothetical protein [Patescibacteria group bacterium]